MRLIILIKEFGVDILTKIQLTSLLGLICFWILITARPDINTDDNFKYVVFTVLGFHGLRFSIVSFCCADHNGMASVG
jgi:hypothetical protein